MPGFAYHLVDVFTDRPFGGNPLAVFPDAAGLPPSLYQPIARELNLSETTFVLPPENPAHHFKVRIFTPFRELPTAGHPTLGTAFVLTRLGLFDPAASGGSLVLEQQVGPVPVEVAMEEGQPGQITMQQAVPRFGPVETRRAEVAAMLSLRKGDLLPGPPIEAGSSGVPFWYVPLASLDAARRAKIHTGLWESLLGGSEPAGVYVLSLETDSPAADVHGRMFAPAFGIAEDPATGIASGPLGAYLVRHGLVPAAHSVNIVSEQGLEMGRPSRIEIGLEMDGARVTVVRVGGRCVAMGSGRMEV